MKWAQLTPFPGNPIGRRRIADMRKEGGGGYLAQIVGIPTVCDNARPTFPDLPRDALVVLEGNHRRALADEDGKLDEEIIVELHRELSHADAHRLRRGLNNRRTVKPAEIFLELVAEGDLHKQAIKAAVEGVGWEVTHDRQNGGLSCTNELEWVWHQDHGAMTRAIESYEAIWGRGESRSQARVIKGLGAFWIRYGDADFDRLTVAMRRSQMSADALYRAGRHEHQELPYIKTVYDGIRRTLAVTYNRGLRKGTLRLS